MEMDQAQLVYCSFGIDCQCFYFFYKGALIFCFSWMTKGMSQLETTGPAWADYLGWFRSRQSVLQSYWLMDIEKNMLMKTRSLSILRFSAGAGKSGPILCLSKFWAFMLQVASVQLFTATILLLSYSTWLIIPGMNPEKHK
ncbi:hypothetical protein V6N12_033014 [Hibiscus sabdariffa]|uniref:Uncharacterized protein n=1 Tax=Hibiscus sabdariffa TaxID=183260 RepID=A0ABR2CF72_9ROSI